jgi:hypothetical protein
VVPGRAVDHRRVDDIEILDGGRHAASNRKNDITATLSGQTFLCQILC